MNTRRFFADRAANLGLMALAAVVVLATPAAWADPPSRAARLSYITGPVALAPAGLPDEWGEAFINRPITVGDRLWADAGGRAELRLGSTAVRIDGGTSLDVLDLDDRLLQVSLDQGRAQVRTRGGPGGNAEIDTPAAAIVINGAADVRVDVDAGTGRTSVSVRFGRANIYTPYESFDLASGETTRIEQDGRYYTIGRAGVRDAFDNFAYTRDVRWREPRYVSAEMTGYEDLDAYGAWQPVAEYGTVWFPRQVATDWAPYRDGRWVWVEPWGWSWVDNAPWGFAPFHYGRWVQVSGRWGWYPGERVARPVYAPALVAFFGGDNFSVSVSAGAGPAIGWFPLGYNDPYIPWYQTSPDYRRAVNVAYVRDTVVLNQVINITNVNVTQVSTHRYRHRDRMEAVTAVPRQVFVSAQPVRQSAVTVSRERVASAPIVVGAAPVAPERASLVGRQGRSERAPRADRVNKPLVAVNTPASAPPRFEQRVQESQREQGKPFEVKPLRDDRREARREDRQEPAKGTAGTTAPQGAAAPATASAPAGRDIRVIRPGPTESREARDRGAGKGPTAQQRDDDRGRGRDRDQAKEQEAPRANVAPGQALPPQAAPQAQERAAPAQGLPPQAAPQAQERAVPNQGLPPQAQDRGAQQREAQQREQQQREQRANQEREQQQRAADERAKGQREAQERAGQQRDEQQRAAEERAKGQREAQERANQQREQQKSAAEERAKGQREAQERAAEERAKGQREAQERANQQREQQKSAAEERAKGQREAQERAAEERAKGQREAQERANQQREQQKSAAEERAKGQREAQERANAQREQQRVAQQQAQAEEKARRAQQPSQQPQAQPQPAPGKGGRDKADDREDREEKERGKSSERRG